MRALVVLIFAVVNAELIMEDKMNSLTGWTYRLNSNPTGSVGLSTNTACNDVGTGTCIYLKGNFQYPSYAEKSYSTSGYKDIYFSYKLKITGYFGGDEYKLQVKNKWFRCCIAITSTGLTTPTWYEYQQSQTVWSDSSIRIRFETDADNGLNMYLGTLRIYGTRITTANPTLFPTTTPSYIPTIYPSANPTIYPTTEPTLIPTIFPTNNPITYIPTASPTRFPTNTPTVHAEGEQHSVSSTQFEEPAQHFQTQSSNIGWGIIVGIFASVICFVIVAIIILFRQLKKNKNNGNKKVEMMVMDEAITRISSVSEVNSDCDVINGINVDIVNVNTNTQNGNIKSEGEQQENTGDDNDLYALPMNDTTNNVTLQTPQYDTVNGVTPLNSLVDNNSDGDELYENVLDENENNNEQKDYIETIGKDSNDEGDDMYLKGNVNTINGDTQTKHKDT